MKDAEELDAVIGEFIARRSQAGNVAFAEKAEAAIGPIYGVHEGEPRKAGEPE